MRIIRGVWERSYMSMSEKHTPAATPFSLGSSKPSCRLSVSHLKLMTPSGLLTPQAKCLHTCQDRNLTSSQFSAESPFPKVHETLHIAKVLESCKYMNSPQQIFFKSCLFFPGFPDFGISGFPTVLIFILHFADSICLNYFHLILEC